MDEEHHHIQLDGLQELASRLSDLSDMYSQDAQGESSSGLETDSQDAQDESSSGWETDSQDAQDESSSGWQTYSQDEQWDEYASGHEIMYQALVSAMHTLAGMTFAGMTFAEAGRGNVMDHDLQLELRGLNEDLVTLYEMGFSRLLEEEAALQELIRKLEAIAVELSR